MLINGVELYPNDKYFYKNNHYKDLMERQCKNLYNEILEIEKVYVEYAYGSDSIYCDITFKKELSLPDYKFSIRNHNSKFLKDIKYVFYPYEYMDLRDMYADMFNVISEYLLATLKNYNYTEKEVNKKNIPTLFDNQGDYNYSQRQMLGYLKKHKLLVETRDVEDMYVVSIFRTIDKLNDDFKRETRHNKRLPKELEEVKNKQLYDEYYEKLSKILLKNNGFKHSKRAYLLKAVFHYFKKKPIYSVMEKYEHIYLSDIDPKLVAGQKYTENKANIYLNDFIYEQLKHEKTFLRVFLPKTYDDLTMEEQFKIILEAYISKKVSGKKSDNKKNNKAFLNGEISEDYLYTLTKENNTDIVKSILELFENLPNYFEYEICRHVFFQLIEHKVLLVSNSKTYLKKNKLDKLKLSFYSYESINLVKEYFSDFDYSEYALYTYKLI